MLKWLGKNVEINPLTVLAHRLSTVKAADRIVVMEKGRIIEEGNHYGLLKQEGHYATLYNTYFRHQSLDYRPPGLDELLAVKLGLTIEPPDEPEKLT